MKNQSNKFSKHISEKLKLRKGEEFATEWDETLQKQFPGYKFRTIYRNGIHKYCPLGIDIKYKQDEQLIQIELFENFDIDYSPCKQDLYEEIETMIKKLKV